MQIHEFKSNHSFEQTIINFKEELPSIGFGILFELPFHEVLASKGFPISKKAIMFEVCKPSLAQGVLDGDTGFGYFLPCKVVIRETNEGVYTGFLTAKNEMVERGGEPAKVVVSEVESLIASVLQNSIQ